jgi:predicted N-acetyltransferase YhbS
VKTKKKQVLELWKTAFDDSDKFTRLYFERVYRDENALVIERDGEILSALQMLPYTMTFCGEEISVAYISGACTLPSEQGKGLMTQLLRNSFEEMRNRGIALTALIPAEKWLFDYYRRQGYTEIFEYSLNVYTRHEYIKPERDLYVSLVDGKQDESCYEYVNKKLRERPACILHTYDDFITILKDLKISKGKCVAAYDKENHLVGMAFVTPPGKKQIPGSVIIKEILFDDERVKRHLLFEITKHFKVFKAVYRIPFNDGPITYPYGMARVIDCEYLVDLWSETHPGSNVTTDDMKSMDVRALTSHLFGYRNKTAYMSLMLD